MKLRLSAFVFAATSLVASSTWADKIAVLPFSSQNNVPRVELEQVRKWTDDAVVVKGHWFATPDEMVSAMATVRDGAPDTSSEYIAIANVVHAEWTLIGHVQRDDVPPSTLPNGAIEDGYTTYRIELEACQVATGRVESLSREILPDDTIALSEMVALLIRPEGLANTPIPWERADYPRPKPQKKAPPPPPPVIAEPPKPEEPRAVYGAKVPFALGLSFGANGLLSAPSKTRGSSAAAPLGAAFGYAFPGSAPGLELRAYFTGQVAGPSAYILDAGARYAYAPIRGTNLFVGPEVMLGTHIASGAEKTARFLLDGSLFAAYVISDFFQVELAGDLGVAAGGSGSLVLGGGTFRFLVRF